MPQTQTIQIRSEQVQDILSFVPHWMIRWGNTLVFLIIIGIFSLSYLIKYPDVLAAEITITTTIPPQKIYSKSSGKIAALLVQDKAFIAPDQNLAILENAANYEDVFLLKNLIDTLAFNYNQPYFPIQQLPRLSLGTIDLDYALFERNYVAYQLNKKLQPFSNEIIANEMAIIEAQERRQILLSQEALHLKELAFKQKDLERSKKLFEEGIISALEYEQKQLEVLREERAYQNIKTSISQIREISHSSNKNLKNTNIQQAQEENRLLKEVIQAYSQLKKSIREWELQYVLKSDIKGKVVFLSIWNNHQTVQAGDLVFTIIPTDNASFIGKIKAPVKSSGKIKRNQTVHISLDNYPANEFGRLKGQVRNISLMADAEGYYLIDVILPETLITSHQKSIVFKQEMRGTAEIITEDLRLIDRLFYQLRQVFV